MDGPDHFERPPVVLIGGANIAMFGDVVSWWQQRTCVHIARDFEAAARVAAGIGAPPLLFVVLQMRPGQWNPSQLSRLRDEFPLARFVVITDTWCEGETRTGEPLPGTVRLPWYHAISRLSKDWQDSLDGQCPTWGLATTSSDEERLLQSTLRGSETPGAVVGIATAATETQQALCALVDSVGFQPRVVPNGGPVASDVNCLLWDDGAGPRNQLWPLADVAQLVAPVPVIALCGFPRLEDVQAALADGAQAVIAKPYQACDLVFHVERSVTRPIRSKHGGAAA